MAGASKSDNSATFSALCVAGQAKPSEIDDFVDHWHDGQDSRTLREALGFSPEEYERWVAEPKAVSSIVADHARRAPQSAKGG